MQHYEQTQAQPSAANGKSIMYRGKEREAFRTSDRTYKLPLSKATYWLSAVVVCPNLYFVCNSSLRPTGEYFQLVGTEFKEVA